MKALVSELSQLELKLQKMSVKLTPTLLINPSFTISNNILEKREQVKA